MRKLVFATVFVAAALVAAAMFAKTENPHVQRIGMVIGIKADQISAYEALHAASNPGVRDLLDKYHMHNFSIYMRQLDDGEYYLFGYYEYTGTDYKADMAKARGGTSQPKVALRNGSDASSSSRGAVLGNDERGLSQSLVGEDSANMPKLKRITRILKSN